MSLKKIEQVKADNGFKIWDLVIYGVVLALTAVLFVVIFTTRNTDPLTGVEITVRGEIVFEYEFGGRPKSHSEKITIDENDKGITVTVSTDNGGLNIVYINKSAKTVKMHDANCKGKQCIHFAAIKNNSGVIICDPHGVKIEPIIKDVDSPDIPF